MLERKYNRPAIERFKEKVSYNGPIPSHRPELGPCHIWNAGLSKSGYGKFRENGRIGRHIRAHRFSYEFCIGQIPDGMEIDHLCRNRACVNPKHLEPVTRKENAARSIPFLKVKSSCLYGHRFTEENTYVRKSGKRVCRTCHRRHANASYRKISGLKPMENSYLRAIV